MNEEVPSRLPSFQGRLNLQDFVFTSSSSSDSSTRETRQSNRLTSIAGSSSSSRSPNKRKPPSDEDTPDGSNDNDNTPVTRRSPATSPSPSPSPSKRRKTPRAKSGYAPPSTYAHLPYLPDAMAPNLIVLFVGLNPGLETARSGHAYAHPTNLFWRLLASSGVTPRLCAASEDRGLPARYALGLTNIVGRPSRNGAELSKREMDAGVAVLEAKTRRWRPEAVCIVGKGIWESVWRVRHAGRALRPAEFAYGWQDEAENMGVVGAEGQADDEREDGVDYGDGGAWSGARVFVATSTSGLAATLRPPEKERIWRELGVFVERRRAERAATTKATATAALTTQRI